MLKRAPLLALVLSFLLLGAVLLTRPPAPATSPTQAASTATNTPTQTPLPTLTPAPTVPIQEIDTTSFTEALVSPSCVVKINPLLAGFNQADRDVSALIFEGLMTTDGFGAIIPDLAAAQPRISADGLTYVFKLREDVRWHDGTPFTSTDVAFTIELMQSPEFPGQPELRDFWQTVEVDALDATTLRFRLAQPLATFPDYLRIGILPEHVLRGTNALGLRTHPFNLSPIGTGPYQFSSLLFDPAQSRIEGVRLAFAGTYAQRPEGQSGFTLRTLNFRCMPTFEDAVAAFQRGEVNSISELPSDVLARIGALPLRRYLSYEPALGAVIYNWQNDGVSFFRDLRMRQALALGVDRTNVVNSVLASRAIAAPNPVLPSSWAYTDGVQCADNNPADAQTKIGQVQIRPAILNPETGEQVPVEGYPFQLLVSNDLLSVELANRLIDAWRALSVNATLVVVDQNTFRERLRAGTFDAALVELNLAPSADPDPYSLWRQSPSTGGLNFGGMNDRRVSEVLQRARLATNGNARVQLYREFQQVFCDRAIALPLYFPVYFYGADERITGIRLGFMAEPSDRFRTIQDWRF
jgi:peptide/nickel transport system substrate-binding protein